MSTMEERKKMWVAEMLHEHKELRVTMKHARDFLQRPRPEPGDEGFHRWATEMSRHLVDLYDRMFTHFRAEERSGVIGDLAERFPRSAKRVERLQSEHSIMLDDLRGLINDVMQYAAAIVPEDPRLRQKLVAVLDRIDT